MSGTEQSAYQEKYWSYRERLLNYFVSVGKNCGQSLPAMNNWPTQSISKPGDNPTITWSDATIYLGWYIGVLATEYSLLEKGELSSSRNGNRIGDKSDTASELYQALLALERLELESEPAFATPPPSTSKCPPKTGSSTGFFIRDDVIESMKNNFPGTPIVFSDYTSSDIYNKEESQDQVCHLLLGLALVCWQAKNATVEIEETIINLSELALQRAYQIIKHIESHNWQIINSGLNKPVKRGSDATWISYGFCKALIAISNGNYDFGDSVSHDDKKIWNSFEDKSLLEQLIADLLNLNPDNLHMTMAVGSVGNGWGVNTLEALWKLAHKQDWYIYPLYYAALYVVPTDPEFAYWLEIKDKLHKKVTDMLTAAPETSVDKLDGICSSPESTNPPGWRASNRFFKDREQQLDGRNPKTNIKKPIKGLDYTMYYNGLDFMLLHNLYLLTY